MNKKNLSYQQEAVINVLNGLKKMDKFKLQAPTGSGKTMITGLIIENLIKDPHFNLKKKTFVFVAPSTGALDHQGYEKLTQYLNKGWLKGFDTRYIGVSGGKTKKSQYLESINRFEENTIYFIGWSLFGKNSNLSRIDSERNNIQRVIQNTKENNTNIILIIDEAHREVITKSENKQVILNEMNPWKSLEISATLESADYKVTLEKVRKEAAIKKNVVISMGVPEPGEIDKPGEIDDLIKSSIKKQKEIKKSYVKRKINDNPLILIQIPDKQKITSNLIIQKEIDDYYLQEVKKSLENCGLKEGLNYAIWLSDKKTTKDKEELTKMSSAYDVLVFKQAIATGWDIPRANILVRLREPKSPKFDIQTLGRILRNPRFKYYDNYLIDNAFVFTRDEKYSEKISIEDFVSSPKSKVNVPLSQLGMLSNLSINSLYYSKPIIEEEVVDNVFNSILNDQKLILNHLNQIDESKKTIINNIEVDAKSVLEGEGIENIKAETIRNKNYNQLAFNFSEDDTLFEIYIKYIAAFENKEINRKAMDKFINHLSKEGLYKKKNIYKKLISSEVIDKRIKEFGSINIFEYIDRLKNASIKKMSEIKTKKYSLSTEFFYKLENININDWDKINTYNLSFKSGWDSEIERDIYIQFLNSLRTICSIANYKEGNKLIHIFRNGVNENSYFVEYYDRFDKKSRFYPDFILIDDISKTADIIEVKGREAIGRNIDNKSNYKFSNAWENEEIINDEYKVNFYRTERATSLNEFNLINKNGDSETLSDFINKKIALVISKIKR